ncbi:MAG: hypothetical protein IJ268_13355 [Proteobacteria bacterium]|nr:hypothetical protein [Pseudomonadota bacterium]
MIRKLLGVVVILGLSSVSCTMAGADNHLVSSAHAPSEAQAQSDASAPSDGSASAGGQAPCLKVNAICGVEASIEQCDARLNALNYKAGDALYSVNYAQYDVMKCFYTEEEFKAELVEAKCTNSEFLADGRNCIFDEDVPQCQMMLDGDNCEVKFTQASCDERLQALNKNNGDLLPGIWFAYEQKLKCFYTEAERKAYLDDKKLDCRLIMAGKDHICITVSETGEVEENCAANHYGEYQCEL